MKKVLLLFLVSICFSCQKEVQLVKSDRTIDSTVVDHTPVYIFFESSAKDTIADVNRKNTIGTTNWIFHVDKRLPLQKAIPEIVALQDKRKKAQFHTNENAQNYFSYTDSIQGKLAFIPFTKTSFTYNSYFSTSYVKENPDYHIHFNTFSVNFKNKNKITVDGNEVEPKELLDFLKEYTTFSNSEKPILIYLNFDERLSFDTYLAQIIALKSIENDRITIAPVHFIYDNSKIQNCDCTL